jgi:hypothetical protein
VLAARACVRASAREHTHLSHEDAAVADCAVGVAGCDCGEGDGEGQGQGQGQGQGGRERVRRGSEGRARER